MHRIVLVGTVCTLYVVTQFLHIANEERCINFPLMFKIIIRTPTPSDGVAEHLIAFNSLFGATAELLNVY